MIKLHYSTLLFLIISYYYNYYETYLILLMIVIIHELSHLLVVLLFNYKFKSLTILPFGGILEYEGSNKYDILLSLAGIISNVVMIILNFHVFFNLIVIFINILPIYPLDGYKVMESIKVPENIIKIISISLIFCLLIISLIFYIPMLFFLISILIFKQKELFNNEVKKVLNIKNRIS